ncbi:MAG: GIDE domain-containing protein [Cellulosilyticaceae bacterium]
MNILIFLVVLLGCGGDVFYAFKKADEKSLDISYMQTSSLKDAIDILNDMSFSDPNYRHYAEIKVTAHSDRSITAPFSGQNVVYYTNECFSVTQETKVTYDSNNKRHTRTVKVEHELASDASSNPLWIKDNSISTPIYLDLQSFDSHVELTQGCDRFEQKNSQFARTHFTDFRGGSDFLGFRLKESILRESQPLYILGELYKMGNEFYFGKAHQAGKTSLLSVKSEDQILEDVKKQKTMAIVKAVGVAILALIFIL